MYKSKSQSSALSTLKKNFVFATKTKPTKPIYQETTQARGIGHHLNSKYIVTLVIDPVLFILVWLAIFKPKQQIMSFTSNTTILSVTNETAIGEQNVMCSTIHSSAEKISKLCAYSVILLGSLFGNIFIIIIVYKHRDLQKTVNYFIVNMAVSDFLSSLIVIPVIITTLLADPSRYWRVSGTLGLIFCKLFHFVGPASFLVSSQSLVWIAIDRFVAIVLPIKLGLISNKIRTIAIVSTWIFGVLLNFPNLIMSRLVQYGSYTTCYDIGSVLTGNKAITAYIWLHITLYFFVPLFFISVLYIAMAISIKKQSKALLDTTPNVQRHSALKKRRQAIQMAVVTVVLFYICVIPPTLTNSITYSNTHWKPSCALQRLLTFLSPLMLYSSFIVNPIICLWFVESYRRGLRNILCSCSRKWNNSVMRKRSNKIVKREQITLKKMNAPLAENCPRTSKKTENFLEETLDTAL